MTTGEQLSAWSTVSNVSAMSHFVNLSVGGGGEDTITYIPAITITAEILQASLDASVSYSVYSADIKQTTVDASITLTHLEGDVSQIKLEGNL